MLTELHVAGMTCGHCAAAVTSELSTVPGVTGVDVDLTSGVVNVHSAEGPDPDALAEAVREAGYTVVDGAGG